MLPYGVSPHTSHSKVGGEETGGGQFLSPPASLASTPGGEIFPRIS